jgi:hypothetical protein
VLAGLENVISFLHVEQDKPVLGVTMSVCMYLERGVDLANDSRSLRGDSHGFGGQVWGLDLRCRDFCHLG